MHNRAFRIYMGALAALAAAAILLGILLLAAPAQQEETPPAYLLRDNAGRVALFAGDGTGPLAEYEVYTRLLPRAEVLALQQGIRVQDEAELQRRLEDLGL